MQKTIGLKIECSKCILPAEYEGATFQKIKNKTTCNFCQDHNEIKFLGYNQLIRDIDLNNSEKIGVTVSGGKDSIYVWKKIVEFYGSKSVIGFNHNKIGLVHPVAQDNLRNAAKILDCELVQYNDYEMFPRFKKNLEALFHHPDPAMVRVALCAGCRVGITGKLFSLGKDRGINKFINASSYLELAPFKSALMMKKGKGNEKEGLLMGLEENPMYNFDNNVDTIMKDDSHCHDSKLSRGGSKKIYNDIDFFDYFHYFPNIPQDTEKEVKNELNWQKVGHGWHFDCQIEAFKDLFYYGLLGYTELENKLSSMIRHNLLSRCDAINQLNYCRKKLQDSYQIRKKLLSSLSISNLESHLQAFCKDSKYIVY